MQIVYLFLKKVRSYYVFDAVKLLARVIVSFFIHNISFNVAGASVYSSELLLNGIVIQKLEYQRLFFFYIKLLPITQILIK